MMLEEGLTYIDETERLRLQAMVDRHRMEHHRIPTREHPPGPPERVRPARASAARAATPV